MSGGPAFGIDLSGYATGRSVCAVAVAAETEIAVTILSGCAFSGRHRRSMELRPIVKREADLVRRMLKLGPVAVDIPIDLQGLPLSSQTKYIWQLTLRPIDRALRAIPPLADRIGAPTARFQNILNFGDLGASIGKRLFETYPGGSRRRLGLDRNQIVADMHLGLNEDETDAAICAVTALPDYRLEGRDLARALKEYFDKESISPRQLPRGYVLLKSVPTQRINIAREDVNAWGGGKLQ